MKENDIQRLLLWYEKNKRDLPWRHTKDAYKIWVSETMLQQTRVDTVVPYYERFLKKLPTLKDLAMIPEEELLKLWEGLGYYSRVRNLQKAAKILCAEKFDFLPPDKFLLEQLPGIGPYTVGAILSIAYEIEEPAIDGNVLRVLSRVYEESEDILSSKVRKKYTEILRGLMKGASPNLFTQSFIELGALVCTKTPDCPNCPLNNCCKAYKHQTVLSYPKKKLKKEKPVFLKTVFLFQYKNTFMIHKRQENGLLANLYEFPNWESFLTLEEVYNILAQKKIFYKNVTFLGEVTHVFSHQKWHLKVYKILLEEPIFHELFVTREEILDVYSIPTVFQKVWKLQKENQEDLDS